MLDKITCGRHAGAEQAARRAAVSFGVRVGGWMPGGISTEAGTERPDDADRARTDQDVQDSDGTLWFGATTTALAHATVAACQKFGKPCLPVYPGASFEPSHVASWIARNQVKSLNVAGNLEPDEPGIGTQVERFLEQVLQLLGHKRI
jgi:hypothetical protein